MKLKLIIILLACANFLFAQKETKIPLKSGKSGIEILQKKSDGFQVKFNISTLALKKEQTTEGFFEELEVDGFAKVYSKGNPGIPSVSKLIEIPIGAKYEIKVISYDVEIIDLKNFGVKDKIAPAQLSVSKNDDPKSVKFYYNKEIYTQKGFIEKNIASIEDIGIMRDTRLGRLELSPIQYNPGENLIKVFNNLVLEIKFYGSQDTNKEALKKFHSSYFQGIIENSIINNTVNAKALLGDSPIKYIIISDPLFKDALQPFIQWKKKMGFIVVDKYTNDAAVGTSTTSIKAYLKNQFTSSADGIPQTFLLLVGDVAQIPAFPGTISGEDHVTDLYYAEYTNDNLPDIYYGRFSATSVAQLQPQIDKTLQVEQVQMSDKSYLDDVVLVAGVDANYAPTYGNGAINYANQYYTNASNGLNSYYYLYGNTSGVMASENSGASASIRSKINQGVSFVNYTAHCSSNGWADPSFVISHVADLTNQNKYPLIIANCCQSAKFELSSFAEEILRSPNKGAVGYIGGSDYTYWDEDYYWGIGLTPSITANPTYENSGLGAYDRFFHLNGESKANWYVTQGQIVVAGNLAVESSNSTRKKYYWEIYHLFGDPSLTPSVSIPTALNAVHASSVTIGTSTFSVTVEKNAYVALTMNGVLIDAKLSNDSNNATLSLSKITAAGTLDIVVTKQNRIPYITQITVNSGGSDTQAPTTPTNLASSNITSSGCSLTWTASIDNVGVIGYDLYQNDALKSSITGTSATITGLAASTTYSYYVKAKDAAGNVSIASDPINVTTLASTQAPTATTVAASGISTAGATLNAQVNANNASTTVTFEYGTTTSYGSTINGTPNTLTGTTTTNITAALTGLTANVTYNYRVKALNSVGTTYGSNMTFTTAANPTSLNLPVTENFATSTLPTGWSTQNVGTSITERWSMSNTTNAGGGAYELKCTYQQVNPGTTRIITPAVNTSGVSQVTFSFKHMLDAYGTGSTLRVQTSNDKITWTNTPWSVATTATNIAAATVNVTITTNLNSATTYFAIVADGNLYQIDYWYIDDVSITSGTSTTIPTVTTNAISGITANAATSGGNVTADGGAAVTERGICYATTANPTTANNKITSGTGVGSFTSNISGLTANTAYYVRAYAINSNGTAYGAQQSFTTLNGGVTYCQSASASIQDEWIKTVTVAGQTNESTGALYTDFTAKVFNLTVGSNSITLIPGFTGTAYREYWKVWIDFNTNGTFTDAGEEVFSNNGTAAVSGTITVPSSASGQTRMRISMKYNAAPTPCETATTFKYGEVEDYTINVNKSKAIDMITETSISCFPNPTNGNLKLQMTSEYIGSVQILVINTLGQVVRNLPFNKSNRTEDAEIDISNSPSGIYIISINMNGIVVNERVVLK